MKYLKKAFWFVVSVLPAGLCLIMQYACAYAVLYYYYFQIKAQRPDKSHAFIYMLASIEYSTKAVYGVLLYHIIAVVVFGVWYYLVWGKKKRPEGVEKIRLAKWPVIIVLGVALQLLVSAILNLIYVVAPELLANYMQMMQSIGLGETTWSILLATVVLAPVGEELLCRGIMLKLAGKVTDKFWIANTIQALAFGVIHMNWVQGIYAFVLGMILGYVYGKYQNILVCMVLHAVINFSSNYVDSLFLLLPDGNPILILTVVAIVACALTLGCVLILGKIRKTRPIMAEGMHTYAMEGNATVVTEQIAGTEE